LIPPAADTLPKLGATLPALLRGVDTGPRTVTLRVREVDTTYPLAAGADIRIDGRATTVADLAALRARPRVKITLNPAGTEIVSLAAEGETVTGMLRGLDADRNTITLLRGATDTRGSPSTWPLTPGAVITIDGNPTTLTDLREGLTASIRLSADGKRVLALDAKSH
jgi:hypothetical protein